MVFPELFTYLCAHKEHTAHMTVPTLLITTHPYIAGGGTGCLGCLLAIFNFSEGWRGGRGGRGGLAPSWPVMSYSPAKDVHVMHMWNLCASIPCGGPRNCIRWMYNIRCIYYFQYIRAEVGFGSGTKTRPIPSTTQLVTISITVNVNWKPWEVCNSRKELSICNQIVCVI